MIYGANGYTGQLIARLAAARGERPLLAGRDGLAVGTLAAELGLDHRVLDLRDPLALAAAVSGVRAVAHCAGPFSTTAAPMVAACLATGAHYLDITGEIDVFETVFARHDAAVAAGVVLLPGAGFDVVPTDCLAARLAAELPTATTLELAFLAGGGMSRGSVLTVIEGYAGSVVLSGGKGTAGGGRVRRNGRLVRSPAGSPRRRVDFPSGARDVAAIRWGDLVTAYRSTGIPDITTYTSLPAGGRGASLSGVVGWAPVRAVARRVVRARLTGPSAAQRAASRSEVWGEVTDSAGAKVAGTLTGPNAYDLTADSMVRAIARVLNEATRPAPGAHTPSSAFGAGYVETLDRVTVTVPA